MVVLETLTRNRCQDTQNAEQMSSHTLLEVKQRHTQGERAQWLRAYRVLNSKAQHWAKKLSGLDVATFALAPRGVVPESVKCPILKLQYKDWTPHPTPSVYEKD